LLWFELPAVPSLLGLAMWQF